MRVTMEKNCDVSFVLNGQTVRANVPDRMTLLKYLRNVECLHGTKEACGMGQCGACSVLIDGKLARSCVTLMKNISGKSVETIEHEARDGHLSVIQKSFLDAGAVQCGFCTPGMVMAAKALLLENPSPSDQEIREGMKNNYCRCTGYVKIIEAVKLAAARLSGQNPSLRKVQTCDPTEIVEISTVPVPAGRYVGASVWDVDGPAKVTGSLKYCDDLDADAFGENEMLHGAFVFAPLPHARINSADYSDCMKAEGVVRVVTAADVPGLNETGTWDTDWPVFCTDEVRFLGDRLAMIIADTDAHARAAVRLARIDYTELPGLFSIAESVKAGSYIVTTGRESGDVDACKTNPDLIKVRVSKEIQPQDHVCMEPVSAIGYAKDGKVTVFSPTQAPFEIRRMLAKNLAITEDKIRVVATPIGGGFGKKCDTFLEGPIAVAALTVDKPVKITLTRAEDMVVTTRRHGYHTDYEVGFSKDGRFQYLDSKMFSDGGPYTCESYGTLMTGCLMSGGPYIIPHVRVDARCAKNNNLLGGAFRGYGINQAAISIETAVDEMAEKLDMDPFEIRRKNALYPGASTVGGEVLESSMGLQETIDRCEAALKEELKKYQTRYRGRINAGKAGVELARKKDFKVLGFGVASGFKNSGVGKGIFVDDGACRLTLKGDGRLFMLVSGTDMGQGFRTAMTQIAAETLKIDLSRIDIATGDTDLTIPTGESVAERQTLCDGRAVYEACRNLQKELEKNPWKPGEERKAEAYFRAPECFPIGDFKSAEEKGVKYRNFPAYAYATQAAIVEVDVLTGKIRVLKVIAAHDVGRAVNPRIIEGQMQGSISMGLGYALTEGHPTKDGYPVKKTYKALGLPRFTDTPDYHLILVEDPEPLGPYGAKGISEVATVPITPAILNAISRAIGVRINKVPASPDVVLDAIRTGSCQVETMEVQAGKIPKP